ncbi:hypothetical protein RSSM_01253 [Rhodopirellula sallentina SM41]|uniref:Uncharacterized protein n=1 Tax=Rhodopirellula sallentina SM41 TaxID=1263870 RepID=M5U7F6_9BACT|nr:hypothetical protein RSSM_01253 [Rhodopirellula sallentina SM41]
MNTATEVLFKSSATKWLLMMRLVWKTRIVSNYLTVAMIQVP